MSNGDRNKEAKIWDEKKNVKYLRTGSVVISLEPTMLQVDFRMDPSESLTNVSNLQDLEAPTTKTSINIINAQETASSPEKLHMKYIFMKTAFQK